MSLPERIESRIERIPEGGCWLWTGPLTREYGYLTWFGATVKVHLVVYRLLRKRPRKGLVLDHTCRNKCCCNPHHLEPVTVKENTRRHYEYVKKLRKNDE